MKTISLILCTIILVTLLKCKSSPTEFKPNYKPFSQIDSNEISESSGIIQSTRHKGIYWTHNDSGDTPRIFAITETGKLIATYNINGAQARDWEDISTDQQGKLHIADFGNNDHKRRDLKIYTISEPLNLTSSASLDVENSIDVNYQDINYNCEALCTDPSGTLILITKDPKPTYMYEYKNNSWVKKQQLDLPGLVTAADINQKNQLAVMTYQGIYLFSKNKDDTWILEKSILTFMTQNEAICWDSPNLLITNEQKEIFKINPDHFSNNDHHLPSKVIWEANNSHFIYKPIDSIKRPSNISFTIDSTSKKNIHIFIESKNKIKDGNIYFMFSKENPEYRLESSQDDSVLHIQMKDKKLTAQLVSMKDKKPITGVTPIKVKKKGKKSFKIVISRAFYNEQKAFNALVTGFDTWSCGWPHSFWPVHIRPYMMAIRKPKE